MATSSGTKEKPNNGTKQDEKRKEIEGLQTKETHLKPVETSRRETEEELQRRFEESFEFNRNLSRRRAIIRHSAGKAK